MLFRLRAGGKCARGLGFASCGHFGRRAGALRPCSRSHRHAGNVWRCSEFPRTGSRAAGRLRNFGNFGRAGSFRRAGGRPFRACLLRGLGAGAVRVLRVCNVFGMVFGGVDNCVNNYLLKFWECVVCCGIATIFVANLFKGLRGGNKG